GEKARLVLAMIVWQRPNLLLLDEPTNRLDLATREALSMALNDFEGTVMLVSHDRALLRAVCDEFWMVGRGAVGPFDGDLDDYQVYLLDEAKRQRELAKTEAAAENLAAKSAAAASVAAAAIAPISIAASAQSISVTGQNDVKKSGGGAEQRKQDAALRQQQLERLRPLKRELEQVDKRMAALATESTALHERLAQAALTPADIAESGRRLKAIDDETARLEERWLELNEQIELAAAESVI
ncbi:MAG: ABC transporter, partial [Giesbergeria sp.]|nr:ABC transporter [Giesbergeria sp.]